MCEGQYWYINIYNMFGLFQLSLEGDSKACCFVINLVVLILFVEYEEIIKVSLVECEKN